MNTERAAYRAEDDEGDDNGAVSFGSGPAFRPVPRIPRAETPPPPQPEKPPIRAGVLFQSERLARIHHAEAAKASSEEEEKKKKQEEDDEKAAAQSVTSAATTPRKLPPKPVIPGESLTSAMPAAETSVGVLDTKEDSGPKPFGHLPDIGDFMPDLPEEPVLIPSPRPTVERVQPRAPENEPTVQINPTEMSATSAEWPVDDSEVNDEPLATPVPPRQSPDYASYNTFETPSSATSEDDDSYALNPTVSSVAGSGGTGKGSAGGGGGTPPIPPRPHGAAGASGGGGGLPPNSPNYQRKYYSAGSGGYNPNSYNASSPNQHGMTPGIERPTQVVINKKGSLWPYVAVLAENIARKRADRKLKKELSGRMDQQDKAQAETNTNQMRLERQQRDMLDHQRRQAIREAHRPSGHEWGVPRYASSETSVSSNGRVTGPDGRPVSVAAAAAAGMRSEGAPAAAAPVQEQMAADMLEQAQPAGQVHERHSAWHTYYEDEHGRQVAVAEYGQGFKGEQKEIGKTHTGDSVAAGLAGTAAAAHTLDGRRRPAGGMSGAGSSGGGASAPSGSSSGQGGYYGQQTSPYQPSLPSGMTSPGLPAGAPTPADPQHQLPEHTKKTNSVPGPLFWLMMVLIVVAFFAAALI